MKQISKLGRFLGPLVFRTNQNVPPDRPVEHNQPKPSTSQQGRIVPSEGQQPRVVDQHNFPQAPVESVAPSPRPIHSPMVEREIQTEPPEIMEQGVQADIPPEPESHPIPWMEDQGTQTGPGVVPPRPVRPFHFLSGGDRGGGYPPRFPPGGGGEDNSGQPSNWYNPILFYLFGLSVCYAGYQWFLLKLQAEIETQLDRLEEERKKDIEPEDTATANAHSPSNVLAPKNPRLMFEVWRARSWQVLKQGGLVFASLFAGANTFQRAFGAIILPRLEQMVRALNIPNLVQAAVGPLLIRIGRAFLFILSPASMVCFFLWLTRNAIGFLGGNISSLIPLAQPIVDVSQSFFSTPKGVSMSVSFLEKTLKVVSCTFLFGSLTIQFKLIFTSKNKVFCCVLISFLGSFIYCILNDHQYVCLLVQNLLQHQPQLLKIMEHPLGLSSILFGSGAFIQCFRFPWVVNFFYISLLYVSALWQEALFANTQKFSK